VIIGVHQRLSNGLLEAKMRQRAKAYSPS
jgi:hypothetical protein